VHLWLLAGGILLRVQVVLPAVIEVHEHATPVEEGWACDVAVETAVQCGRQQLCSLSSVAWLSGARL
jgi:hypothetical protein